MKKLLTIILVLITISCSSKFGQGGNNACQYVKEQVPGLANDIASIEVIKEDSLLSDAGMVYGEVLLARSCAEYQEGKLSKDTLRDIIDSLSNNATDISYSWRFSTVINDSLKTLAKYENQWRKAYTVRITMKSGDTKEPRVLMDNDGTTPRMMERDMEKAIEEFTKKILSAQELLWL